MLENLKSRFKNAAHKRVGRQILRYAAALIKTHGHCKEASARDKYGAGVLPGDKHAEQFCILGAVSRARHDLFYKTGNRTFNIDIGLRAALATQLHAQGGWGAVNDYNDRPETTAQDAINLLLNAAKCGLEVK